MIYYSLEHIRRAEVISLFPLPPLLGPASSFFCYQHPDMEQLLIMIRTELIIIPTITGIGIIAVVLSVVM